MPTMSTFPTFDVALYFGPSSMLYCVALILFGAVCTQCYAYWMKCKDDPPVLRYCVLLVFLMESLHTAAMLHFLYHYLIDSAFNAEKLSEVIWTAGAIVVFAVSIMSLVQGFYTYRIHQLSNGNRLAVSALAVSLLLRTGFALATAVLMIHAGTWKVILDSRTLPIMIDLSLSMNTVTDIMLTTLFVFYLRKCQTNFDRTQHVVKTLIIYSLNTGALTIVGSLAVLVTYLSSPTLTFAGMYAVVCKLYANSMLAQLNTRGRVQELSDESPRQIPLNGIRNEMNQRARRAQAEIRVDVVKQTMTDPDEPPFSPKATSDSGHRARDSFD